MEMICKQHNKKLKYFCMNNQNLEHKCSKRNGKFMCIICIKNHDSSCLDRFICSIEDLKNLKFQNCNQQNNDVYLKHLNSLQKNLEKEIDQSINKIYEYMIENAYQIDYEMEDLQNINKIKDIKKYYKQTSYKDDIYFESKLKKTMKNLDQKLRGFKEINENSLNVALEGLNSNIVLNTKFLTLLDFDCSQYIGVDQVSSKKFIIQNLPTSPHQFNCIKLKMDSENFFFNLKIKQKSDYVEGLKMIKLEVIAEQEENNICSQFEELKQKLKKFSENLNFEKNQTCLEYNVNIRTWPVKELRIFDEKYRTILDCKFAEDILTFSIMIKSNQIFVEISQEQIIQYKQIYQYK